MGVRSAVMFRMYKRRSSAYMEMLWMVSAMGMPHLAPSRRNRIARGSTAKAKIRGDSGHPYLVPLSTLNGANM